MYRLQIFVFFLMISLVSVSFATRYTKDQKDISSQSKKLSRKEQRKQDEKLKKERERLPQEQQERMQEIMDSEEFEMMP